MARQKRLLIDIYENHQQDPIIGHVFYGETEEVINSIIQAHMGTDRFFRAAMTTKIFGNITLKTESTWLN